MRMEASAKDFKEKVGQSIRANIPLLCIASFLAGGLTMAMLPKDLIASNTFALTNPHLKAAENGMPSRPWSEEEIMRMCLAACRLPLNEKVY